MTENTTILPTKPPPWEETITEAIEGLKSCRDYLSVANFLCEIDIETQSHGIAVQDAIKGTMQYSNDSIDGCIVDLEAVLKASGGEVGS